MGDFFHHSKSYAGTKLLALGCFLALQPGFIAPAFAQTGRLISSEDIYENPDDHELNLNYAKQEIQRGEMLNAASALERMLYQNPNWHSSRLLYAAVLYRLDDPKAALRELSLLKGRDLNPQQLETYTRYLTKFEKPISQSLDPETPESSYGPQSYAPEDPVTASLNIGARLDNNAGNALTDESFGFSDRGDASLFAAGKLEFNQPISADSPLTFRAAIGGQLRRHETFSKADYDVIDLRTGLSRKIINGSHLSLDIDGRRINVSGEKYLEQVGPRVTFGGVISDKTRAVVSVSAYSQDYSPISGASLEDERDGVRTRFQVGLQRKLSGTQKLSLASGYDTKTAEIPAFAYSGPNGLIVYEQRLQNDTKLKTLVRVRQLNFRDSLDPNTRSRKDTRLSVRQSMGVPLKQFISEPTLKNVEMEVGLNYTKRFSNIDANEFRNLGIDMTLKFGF